MKKNIKRIDGITLIALVVTIVVLLILAGISIAMLGGDNGIIKQAKKAKDETILSEIKEEIDIAWNKVLIDKNIAGIDIDEQASRLKNILKEKDPKAKTIVNKEEGIIDVTYRNYNTKINTNKLAKIIWKDAKGGELTGLYGVDSNGDVYSIDQILYETNNFNENQVTKLGFASMVIREDGKAYFGKICINDNFQELKNERILEIGEFGIVLENGKAYRFEGTNLLCVNEMHESLKETKIIDIFDRNWYNHTITFLKEDGKAYILNENDNSLLCINEIYEELKNEKIKDIIMNGYVLLENGKMYIQSDTGQLICFNEMMDELKEQQIEKVVLTGQMIVLKLKNSVTYLAKLTDGLLVDVTEEYKELKNKQIADIDTDNNGVQILLNDGNVCEIDENGNFLEEKKLILQGKNIKETISGTNHTVALSEDGKVYEWGYNYYGQLGNGTTENSNIPICISEINGNILKDKNIIDISAGYDHTVALDNKGKVYVWGCNSSGQLGNGTTENSNIPICISEINGNILKDRNIIDISAGGRHTIALDDKGEVYAWGDNDSGQLGNGTNNDSNIPVYISINLVNIKKISAGSSFTIALDDKGKVYAWGDNYNGQLGNGTNNDSSVPICISDISTNLINIKEISAGNMHTIALDDKGRTYTWGG